MRGVMRQSQPMSSRDFLRRLDRLLRIRRCIWLSAFVFVVVAYVTAPRGLGNLPRRGSDLWGYLVVSGEFKWVFMIAALMAIVLAGVAVVVERLLASNYRYRPNDREPHTDGE